ncbi:MAG: hypothetical protein JXA96_14165 [Sedimentisphaerales bacterium]|nr:hypothetical protein [Sedimentisphaerales bacterium]
MKARIYKVTKLLCFFFCICNFSNANANQILPISGQVVDYMARPVEDAEIAIIHSEYYDGEHYTKVIAPFVKTDKNGRFEVLADVTSQYDTYIIARKAGLAHAWNGLSYNSDIKEKAEFLLVLEKANTLTGKVVDYKGNAVPGAAVHAIPKTSYMSRLYQRPIFGPKEWFTTKTDSKGIFTFDYFSEDVGSDFHVKAPNWNCTYKYTTHYQSACGFEVWRSDIKLVLPEETKVKGRVVEAGSGKALGGVEFLIKSGRDIEDIFNRYLPFTIVSNPDGSFVCEGLSEGKHIIESPIEETKVADWVIEQVEVNVSLENSTKDIEVKVQKGGIIEYTVRDSDIKQHLSDRYVTTSKDDFYVRSRTDKQGITRKRVLPGEYEASAGGKGYDWWSDKQPIIVKEDEVTHVDIELPKKPSVSGIVFDLDGKPAKDILVTVKISGDEIYTKEDGRFVVRYDKHWAGDGLFVLARDIPRNLAAIVHTKDFNEPSQLSLSPSLIIKGKITDPNGKGIPASRVGMSLYLDSQNVVTDLGTEVFTENEGLFELKAIPKKPNELEYRIEAYSTGFAPKTYVIRNIKNESSRIIDLGVIELQPANMSITGTVEDANGLPQPHTIIFLGGREGVGQPQKNTATDEQGRFEIRGVREGPLSVSANFSSDPKGTGSTSAYAGDKDIKIVLGKNLRHEYVPPHKSLKNEPLPDISDFGIEPKEIEGKRTLVCFFDIEQRPSRNGILELSKKAKELKEKNIVVIAIHATNIEKEYLGKWFKENSIDLHVGMIKENPSTSLGTGEGQTKFNWGVKALPWLILTDKDHVVKAEGFPINELDEKIKEIENDKQ